MGALTLTPNITTWAIAASWPTAPAGVCGKPVGTSAGPTFVAAGMLMVSAGTEAMSPSRASIGST